MDLLVLDTIAALKVTEPFGSQNVTTVFLRGRSAANDGGGGVFQYIKSAVSTSLNDDGWHIVTNLLHELWVRVDSINLPQQWGAYPSDNTAIDQAPGLQKFLDFWSNPWSFAGFKERPPKYQTSFRSEVPAANNSDASPLTNQPTGGYVCWSTLNVTPPALGQNYYAGQAPGPLIFHGQVLTRYQDRIAAFKVNDTRSYSKPTIYLRCRKLRSGGQVAWNEQTVYPYPTVYDSDETYRVWTNNLVVYRNERIKVTIASDVYLYDVVDDGQLGAVPTTTTPPGTSISTGSGKVSVMSLGKVKNASGATVNSLLATENDIGVLIESLSSHPDFWCTADGYCVGVMCKPLAGYHVGWNTIHVPQLFATKFGVVLAGNNAQWVNENRLHLGLIAQQAYDTNPKEVDPTRSIYGVVFTMFNSSTQYPTHNHVSELSVEVILYQGYRQAVQTVFYHGRENIVSCRNDQPNVTLPMFCARHTDPSINATLNRVESARVAYYESNGYANYVLSAPFETDNSVEYSIPNLENVASFSGSDRVYFAGVASWQYDEATPRPYSKYYGNPSLDGIRYRPGDRGFNISPNNALALGVYIPENGKRDVYIQLDRHFSKLTTGGNASRADLVILDDNGNVISITPWSPGSIPVRFHPYNVIFPSVPQPPGTGISWLRSGANTSDPLVYGFDSWVRHVAIRIWGEYLRGFRIRVYNSSLATIYPLSQSSSSLTMNQFVKQKPNRGVVRTPTVYRYIEPVGSARATQLNLADVENSDIYVTNGPWISGMTTSKGEWLYVGTNVYESQMAGNSTISPGSDPTNWVLIKAGAAAIVTSLNWIDF